MPAVAEGRRLSSIRRGNRQPLSHVGPAAIHENFVPARPSFVAKADSKAGLSAQIQAHRPDVRDGPAEVCPEGTLESKGGALGRLGKQVGGK